MKVLCFRYPRNKVTDILICLLCVFIIALILVNAEYRTDVPCVADDVITSFFENNGWIVDPDSESVTDKTLPLFFDETNREYSLLQQNQGFDIEKYRGKKISVITYTLLNYPEYEDNGNVYINLLVYDNEIIGADILCTSIHGFITGAVRNGNNET